MVLDVSIVCMVLDVCIVCMLVVNVAHAQIIKPRASIVNRAFKHVSESTPIQTIIKTMHELLTPGRL